MFHPKLNHLCPMFWSFPAAAPPAVFVSFGPTSLPSSPFPSPADTCLRSTLPRQGKTVKSRSCQRSREGRGSLVSATKFPQSRCNELCDALTSAVVICCSAVKAADTLKDLRWSQHDVEAHRHKGPQGQCVDAHIHKSSPQTAAVSLLLTLTFLG